jgi:hypothetical protein
MAPVPPTEVYLGTSSTLSRFIIFDPQASLDPKLGHSNDSETRKPMEGLEVQFPNRFLQLVGLFQFTIHRKFTAFRPCDHPGQHGYRLFEYRQTNQTKEDIRKDPKGSMISFPGRCLSKFSYGSLGSEYCRLEATSAPTSAIIPRSGFVDSDCSSFYFGSVQFCHRFLCFLICGHLDESKSSRCSR